MVVLPGPTNQGVRLLQAMRFGGSKDQLNEAVALAFELCPVQKEAVHKASRKTLDMVGKSPFSAC